MSVLEPQPYPQAYSRRNIRTMNLTNSFWDIIPSSIIFGLFMYIGLVIVYITFSIIAITNNSFVDMHAKCESSHISAFLIYTICAICFFCSDNNNNNTVESADKCITFEIIKMLITVIWGTYELFFPPCIDNIKPTTTWKICFAYWLVNAIIVSGFGACVCVWCWCSIFEFLHEWCSGSLNIPPEPAPTINPIHAETTKTAEIAV